jgi:hypothetical protein
MNEENFICFLNIRHVTIGFDIYKYAKPLKMWHLFKANIASRDPNAWTKIYNSYGNEWDYKGNEKAQNHVNYYFKEW